MRKCNEAYQLAKDQALVKKLQNKRFRPFCLCLPGVMFVIRGSENSLFSVFDILSNLDCGQWYKFCRYIFKTQIDVQPLIDVQSSNRRPILKYMAVCHFLKSTSNDVTDVYIKRCHIRSGMFLK